MTPTKDAPPSWAAGPMAAFDTETSGPEPADARIVTACVVTVNVDPPERREWLIDPGVEIPAEATAIHGISTAHAVEHGISLHLALPGIRDALQSAWAAGQPVVAFNASYDLTVLDCELRRHEFGGIGEIGPVIDPLVLDRYVDRYRRGSRKLVDACRFYGVRIDAAHDSTEDALAAARVAWRIAQRHPAIAAATLPELQDIQREAHWEWATHFAAYLASKGTPEHIDTAWPIRRTPATPMP